MNDDSHIPLSQSKIESDILGNTRDLWLQPPADDREASALAIFLDGEFFVGHFDAPATMARLQREGALPPMWSAYVAGGDRENRWPENFCNPDFARFVCEELLAKLEPKTGALGERMLTGVSLTGLGAAHAALTYPETFSRVLCLSGSFWWEQVKLPEMVASFTRANTAFRLTVGDQESKTQVDHGHGLIQELSQITGVRAMHEALEEHGFDTRYSMYAGGHDAASWRRELPDDLRELWARGAKR